MQGRRCGLCGVESLDQALRDLPKLKLRAPISPSAIHRALDAMPALQSLNRLTHSLHAAAFCTRPATFLGCARMWPHNAFDKLIGALAKANVDATKGFAVITSRCSFEMARRRSPRHPILARSRRDHLAIKLAESYDLAGAGALRQHEAVHRRRRILV